VDFFHHQAGEFHPVGVAAAEEKVAVGGDPGDAGMVQVGEDGGLLFKQFQGLGGGFDQDFQDFFGLGFRVPDGVEFGKSPASQAAEGDVAVVELQGRPAVLTEFVPPKLSVWLGAVGVDTVNGG